jgi:transposase
MEGKKSEAAKAESLRKEGALNPRPRGVKHQLFQEGEFFDPKDLVQVKYEMLREVQAENKPIKQTAAAFGFSRPSFYEAQSAFQEKGLYGLLPRKRGPKRNHKLTGEVMEYIEQTRAVQRTPDTAELARLVKERFGVVVHPRSIERKLVLRQKKRR